MTAERFLEARRRYGAETVWPYYYAGTMGLVQRDGINRLRHVKKYSGFSIRPSAPTWPGPASSPARGALPASIRARWRKADVVVIWGTNPVSTQVNVMTHAMKARKERGAKIVVVDIYRTARSPRPISASCCKPGTDAALACAVMHVLFRDGFADRAYLAAHFTDVPAELEAHLQSRTPEWAAAITGLTVARDRGLRRSSSARTQEELLPPRLRLRPPAQRRGQHARRAVRANRHRRLAI
jgi:anaerobic selenocysteine-containing dehydrogenase